MCSLLSDFAPCLPRLLCSSPSSAPKRRSLVLRPGGQTASDSSPAPRVLHAGAKPIMLPFASRMRFYTSPLHHCVPFSDASVGCRHSLRVRACVLGDGMCYFRALLCGRLVRRARDEEGIWRPRRVSRYKAHRTHRGVARYVRRRSVPRPHHQVAGVGNVDIGRVALHWLHFVRYERYSAQVGSRRLRHRCFHALH